MTISRAVILLCQMYLPQFDEEEQEALSMAIHALQEKEERERRENDAGRTCK